MSGPQLPRVEADGVEAHACRYLAAFCREASAVGCTPANAVALMVKECIDSLGEIDEAQTRTFLRVMHEAYVAKTSGDMKANVKAMTKVAACVERLALLEIQKFSWRGSRS